MRNLNELTLDILNEEEKFKVLVYYGIGGIGKTSLKNKLKNIILDDSLTKTVALEVDFREVRSRECSNGLLDLYNSLKQNKKYNKTIFPHFELAYAIYFKKKNPDIIYNEREEGVIKFVDLGLKVFGFINIADFGLSAFLTKEGINKAYSKFKGLKLNNEMKDNIIDFGSKSISNMEEDLILYFAYDLNNTFKNKHNLKTVIFIDTFEALFGIETHELKKIAKTEWVQQLILNLPNVLFVITGRDKISWDKKWEPFIDQHLISELAPEYSHQFLEKCGVEEVDIQKKIVDYSGGHPYYLDLSVDTYFSIKNENRQPVVDDFGTTKKEILDRFVTSLNDNEVELLKVMSIPNYYNNDIFKYLIEQFNISYSATKFDTFNQYSFVNFNESLQRFTLHQLMRSGMQEYIKEHTDSRVFPTFIETANEKLLTLFEEKYKDDKKSNIFECVYHRLRIRETSDTGTFFEWLNQEKLDFMKNLQLYGDTVLLSNMFEQIRNKYTISLFSVELFNIYEDIVHLSGNYKESVELAEMYLERFSKDEILSNHKLIKLKYRIIHHKMFFVNADDLINELKILHNEVSKEHFFVEHCEITYMLGGGVGFLTGKLDDYKDYLNSLVESIESYPLINKELNNIRTRAIRKLVDYYRIKGETKLAEEMLQKTLDIKNLNRYQIYLCCSYAEVQRELKNYTEAIKYFELVMKETKNLGIKGWQAHSYLSLANVYLDLRELVKAKEYLNDAFVIYESIDQKWGIVNSNILHARILIVEQDEEYLAILDKVQPIAEKFSYRYELQLINTLKQTKEIGLQKLLYV